MQLDRQPTAPPGVLRIRTSLYAQDPRQSRGLAASNQSFLLMIEVRQLVKSHGSLRVLDGVSLFVGRGEVAAVIGPSGGGKSTLLRCINGLEPFEEGEVQVGDLCLSSGATGHGAAGALRQLRCRVGMVFQQFNLFPHMTVLENVLTGPMYAL